jgi:hypothetical protein
VRRAGLNTLVLLGYTAVSVAYFGAPLLRHPGRYLIGSGTDDISLVWSFAWWLHALETWQNPFYSHAIYAPFGINLAWSTTAPGLALVFTPLTRLTGPDVSYNVATTLAPALGAVGIAVLVSAPIVYYALSGFQSGSVNVAPSAFDGDLLNFVVPTDLTWAGGARLAYISNRFRGNAAENGAYLGLPALAIIAWYAVGSRRSATGRYLLTALGVAVLITLGTALVVENRTVAWLPWRLLAGLPPFTNLLPDRVSMYMALVASVIVALWTASRHGWTRWLLPALAVVTIYRLCFPPNENLAVFPLGHHDSAALWQAESGFYFRLAGGYIIARPQARDMNSDPLIPLLWFGYDNRPTVPQILRFVKDEQVDRLVMVDAYDLNPPTPTQLHRFGEIQGLQGVFVAPACSYPSLRKGIHPTPPYAP